MIVEELKEKLNNAPPWADDGKATVVFEVPYHLCHGATVELCVDDVNFNAEKGITVIKGFIP